MKLSKYILINLNVKIGEKMKIKEEFLNKGKLVNFKKVRLNFHQ